MSAWALAALSLSHGSDLCSLPVAPTAPGQGPGSRTPTRGPWETGPLSSRAHPSPQSSSSPCPTNHIYPPETLKCVGPPQHSRLFLLQVSAILSVTLPIPPQHGKPRPVLSWLRSVPPQRPLLPLPRLMPHVQQRYMASHTHHPKPPGVYTEKQKTPGEGSPLPEVAQPGGGRAGPLTTAQLGAARRMAAPRRRARGHSRASSPVRRFGMPGGEARSGDTLGGAGLRSRGEAAADFWKARKSGHRM